MDPAIQKTIVSGFFVLCLVTPRGLDAALQDRAGQGHIRELFWDPRVSIASRLQEDDNTVIIKIGGNDLVFDPSTSSRDMVRFGILQSDAIVIATIADAHPVLVQNASWIDTVVHGTVNQVLKLRGKKRASLGGAIDAHIRQGEMQIGTVHVRAGSALPSFDANRQYLLFLRWEERLDALVPSLAPALIEGNRLQDMWGHDIENGDLAGLTLHDVVEAVRVAR